MNTVTATIEVPIGTGAIIALDEISTAIKEYRANKSHIKALETANKIHRAVIEDFMGPNTELLSTDGVQLATWKYNADSERVDSKRLKAEYPDVYNQVVELVAGNRTFK